MIWLAGASAIRLMGLGVGVLLPAMIARDTLERLRGADWAELQTRIKVPRSKVYMAVIRAFAGRTG